jgi:hypothetical protein
MDEPDVCELLWSNVQALMKRAYGGDNITRLGRETGIATGGAQRLKGRKDVGVRLIERVATHFKIDAWQLLAPGLGRSMLLSDDELEAVRRLRNPMQPRGGNVAELAPIDGGARRIPKMPTQKNPHPKRRTKRA